MRTTEQEVGDDLSSCVRNIPPPEVSTLPILVAISLGDKNSKVEIKVYQITACLVWEHLMVSHHLACFGVHGFSASGNIMYSICLFVT